MQIGLGRLLSEAGDGVEVALTEAHLPLVGPPLAGEAAVDAAETPAAGLRCRPRASAAVHPGIISLLESMPYIEDSSYCCLDLML